MWMQYSSLFWTEAIDLKSSVERLTCELQDLIIELEHSMNYDFDVFLNEEAIQNVTMKIKKYVHTKSICNAFLTNIISLDDFCKKLIEADAEWCLHRIKQFLPPDIVEKYCITE